MYRVELKAVIDEASGAQLVLCVPNVPCGVESLFLLLLLFYAHFVPNVPCGVERKKPRQLAKEGTKFLMYRVELKEVPTPLFRKGRV